MEGDESTSTTTHAAEYAASSAAAAASAADAAASESTAAALAAEHAQAHVATVETALAEVVPAAEAVAEAAIISAAETIAQHIEDENTWMANELTEVKRQLTNLETISESSSQRLSTAVEMIQSLSSSLQQFLVTQTPTNHQDAGEGREVPETPIQPSAKKHHLI